MGTSSDTPCPKEYPSHFKFTIKYSRKRRIYHTVPDKKCKEKFTLLLAGNFILINKIQGEWKGAGKRGRNGV